VRRKRHVRCANLAGNVTFGAPIRVECVCRRWPCGGEAEAMLRSKGGRQGRAEGAGGGWRSDRDVCGAANVTLGATNVTPYSHLARCLPRFKQQAALRGRRAAKVYSLAHRVPSHNDARGALRRCTPAPPLTLPSFADQCIMFLPNTGYAETPIEAQKRRPRRTPRASAAGRATSAILTTPSHHSAMIASEWTRRRAVIEPDWRHQDSP